MLQVLLRQWQLAEPNRSVEAATAAGRQVGRDFSSVTDTNRVRPPVSIDQLDGSTSARDTSCEGALRKLRLYQTAEDGAPDTVRGQQ